MTLIDRLNGLVFTLNDEEGLTITGVTTALKESLDREKVTKRFYDYFKQEHDVHSRSSLEKYRWKQINVGTLQSCLTDSCSSTLFSPKDS